MALYRKLNEKNQNLKIDFVIDKRPIANNVFDKLKIPYHKIPSAPFPRKKFWQICMFTVKNVYGIFESIKLIKKLNPDVVVAFGAYISVPVAVASYFLRKPVILHEQNYFPGLANRFLTFIADKVAVSYTSSLVYFPPEKSVLTGNPVRSEIFKVTREAGLDFLKLDPDMITILVFGGSQGSANINLAVMGILPYLEDLNEEIQFVHISGNKNLNKIKKEYLKFDFKVKVYEYLPQMEYAYSVADIIISRAGATTIAEISALGIPSILIPYAEATSQHQMLNTKPICEIGGAICYDEKTLSGEGLAIRLLPLIRDPGKREEMSVKMKNSKERFKNAAESLAEVVLDYVNNSNV